MRPHLSMGLPFRSRSLLLLMHLPKHKTGLLTLTSLSRQPGYPCSLLSGRTRGFASPPFDGFAFSLAVSTVVVPNSTKPGSCWSRAADSHLAVSTTRLSSLSIGPVVLRPHLSMGLPFRSRSLFCCHTPIIAQSDQRVGKGYVRALLVLREERLK